MRQRAEEPLGTRGGDTRSELARYTELFDYAPIGYVVVDAAGIIRALNFAGARMLRGDRRDLVGRRFDSFVGEADRCDLTRTIARVLAQSVHTTESCELALMPGGGESRDVRLTMSGL